MRFNNRSLTVSVAECLEWYTEKQGSLVRFPVEAHTRTCIVILRFSLTSRCSQIGEDLPNEIKHDIHPE